MVAMFLMRPAAARPPYYKEDMVSATIYAMALRQLCSVNCSRLFDPHNPHLHMKRNKLFGMEPPTYVFQARDSLLKMVKDELARHGIAESSLPSPEGK
jgi:hypothetical protein